MNIILGYSESQLSRVTDVLVDAGEVQEICIVQNIPVHAKYPYCVPEVLCTVVEAHNWQPAQHNTFLFGVAKPAVKRAVFDYFQVHKQIQQTHYRNLVHPSAVVSASVVTANGFFAEPNAVVASFTTIGFGVTINRLVSVGHHCSIGDFVTLNPGVHVAGHCNIGNAVQIGIGTVVFDHVTIGEGSIIGGGSVVTKDIPAGVKAWGNPCKVISDLF